MGYWRSIRRKHERWTLLTGEERRYLVQALILVSIVGMARRLASLRWLQSRLAALFPLNTSFEPGAVPPLSIARWVTALVQSAAGLARPRANCLDRSLTLWGLLRRRGLDAQLRLGVRREGVDFEAHAWVELDGVVLNDRADVGKQFAAFDTPIAAHPSIE